MTLYEIFAILIIHWVADFLLQTDKMAQGKSKNWGNLLDHTFTYSLTWIIPIVLILPNGWTTSHYVLTSWVFASITFVCHTITDYFTSRLNSRLWEQKKVHWFFVSIGVDQILHYIQLFLTYKLLIS